MLLQEKEEGQNNAMGDFKMLIPQIKDLLPKHPHGGFSKVTTLIHLKHGWAEERQKLPSTPCFHFSHSGLPCLLKADGRWHPVLCIKFRKSCLGLPNDGQNNFGASQLADT